MLASKLSACLAFLPLLAACGSEVKTQDGDGGGGGAGDGGSTNVVTASTTTGAGGGIGEPSDVYPAPHPDAPTVANLGGPIMTAPVFVPIYFASDDQVVLAGVTDFTQQLGATDYWAATTAEYGVGPATARTPIVLTEAAPTTIDDSEVSAWLAAKLNADDPAFGTPSVNTLYAIYYPAGTTITMNEFDGGVSCSDFGGYHSNTTLDAAHGNAAIPYTVLPNCGFWGDFTGTDALTVPSSHEFIEAATDPLPLSNPAYGQPVDDHVFLAFIFGGETTDLCAQNYDAYTKFPGDIDFGVSRSWSNASALASHDPCVPIKTNQAYFNAAPVVSDSINLGGGYHSLGVEIAEGESKTIPVALFSDGPTLPFGVYPEDITYFFGGSGQLSLELDEYAGQNGQKLHLTITVDQASDFGIELFMLRASLGNQEHTWVGLVGQP